MEINLFAVGKNSPTWIKDVCNEYTRRLPQNYKIKICEIPIIKRIKNTPTEIIKQAEAQSILVNIPKGSLILALDEHGKQFTTQELAQNLQKWEIHWPSISLLIGGPDGLADSCLKQAHHIWSLSKLTFPHQLVKVIVVEQLYRAWSILAGHPYHRT